MNLETVGSDNYAAAVVTVTELKKLGGLDNLLGLSVFGHQALVPKSTQIGDKLVVFFAGSRLSHQLASENNLYRHGNLNVDRSVTGYIEDNRRVRAIALRKHDSNALALPISALASFTADFDSIPPGTTFDTIDGKMVVEKYVNVKTGPLVRGSSAVKKSLVPDTLFPEHFDTSQYARSLSKYSPSDHVVVTQKLHGTSVRFGTVRVPRVLSFLEKTARFFGAKIAETEHGFVVGSRRVTKSVNGIAGGNQPAEDIWSVAAAPFADKVPPGFLVYAEIVGWMGNKPIQGNYTYDLEPGQFAVYAYRVTTINERGDQFDLSWDDTVAFCERRGIRVVPELWRGNFAQFHANADKYLNVRFFPDYQNALPLSDRKSVDEGIVIRSQCHAVTKHKSPIFLGHESKLMDQEAVDIEQEEAVA